MMYPSNFLEFLTFSMYSSQHTKWRQITARLNCQTVTCKQFFNENTGNAIKIFDVGVEGDFLFYYLNCSKYLFFCYRTVPNVRKDRNVQRDLLYRGFLIF